jgi:hypothetical protein
MRLTPTVRCASRAYRFASESTQGRRKADETERT